MKNKNIISVLLLLGFIVNICAPAHPNTNLSVGSSHNDIISKEYSDKMMIEEALVVNLLMLDGGEFSAIDRSDPVHPRNLQFFFNEQVSLGDNRYSLKCVMWEKDALRTRKYYAVYSSVQDERGEFPMKIYSPEEQKALGIVDEKTASNEYLPVVEDPPYFIGMSMGATKLYAGVYRTERGIPELVGEAYSVEWKKIFKLKNKEDLADPEKVSPDAIFQEVVKAVRFLLKENNFPMHELNNIGCTIPGPVDEETGVIGIGEKMYNMPFHEFPFAENMRKEFGDVSVAVMHDARAGVEGELALGELVDVKNGYFVIQGTGLGGSMAVNGEYYTKVPELTEPGHHIVGRLIKDENEKHAYKYAYRFISNGKRDHPYEVVTDKAYTENEAKVKGKKAHYIKESTALNMMRDEGYVNDDFIWVIHGEKDFEDISSGAAIADLLKNNKDTLVKMFGGAIDNYAGIDSAEDIAKFVLNEDEPVKREKAIEIIQYIADEMGKGLAVLIAFSHSKGVVLDRIVLGSSVGEGLGKDLKGNLLTTETGEDFYFHHIQQSAFRTLSKRLNEEHMLSEDFIENISEQIVRSDITQDERETAGFDASSDPGEVVLPSSAGFRNTVGTYAPMFQMRSEEDWGIGDFVVMKKMIDLHSALGQNFIQMPPIPLSSASDSPYSVASSKSLDPIYINIRAFLDEFDIPPSKAEAFIVENTKLIEELRNKDAVDYYAIRNIKTEALRIIWNVVKENEGSSLYGKFNKFLGENANWLEDHMLYILLKRQHMRDEEGEPDYDGTRTRKWDWRSWEKGLRDRDTKTIKAAKEEYREDILFESFMQFVADKQYKDLSDYGKNNGVQIMVDMPFALDGADIWINPEVFGLKKENGYRRKTTHGVPAEKPYPKGQYWQFYPYDWSNPTTIGFVMDIFKYYQTRASYIRIDHVLGYYRAFLITEDVEEKMTLKELGLYDRINRIRQVAWDSNSTPEKEAASEKIYNMITDRLFEMRKDLPSGLSGTLDKDAIRLLFDDDKNLRPDNSLMVARKVPVDKYGEKLAENSSWKREYVVEKSTFKNEQEWDFIKISKYEANEWDRDFLYNYLFPEDGTAPPLENDSIRLGYFKLAPGEKIMSEFMRLAQEKETRLILETLGVVPEEIKDSVELLNGWNYLPVIYGEDPWSPYNIDNHISNAFVTFGLADSPTMKERWENEQAEWSRDTKKNMLLKQESAGGFEWDRDDWDSLTYRVRKMLLKSVYASVSQIAGLTWVDILGLPEKYRVNMPGAQTAQWVNRLPADCTIENFLAALKGEVGEHLARAREAISLMRELTEEGKRLTPELDPDEKKILNVTPEDGGVVQLRELFTEPFHVDAYVHGYTAKVEIIAKGADGIEVSVPMKRVKISKESTLHGLPDGVFKWTARWSAIEAGTYEFCVKAEGIEEKSKGGKLIAVASETDLNPQSPDHMKVPGEIKTGQARIISDKTRLAKKVAGEICTHPDKQFKLLMANDVYVDEDEFEKHKREYGDRFELGRINPNDYKNIIANASGDKLSIALVSDTMSEADLDKLSQAGIRFIRTNTDMLPASKYLGSSQRIKLQENIYTIMFLARYIETDLNDQIDKTTSAYELLKFYIGNCFNLSNGTSEDGYIDGIVRQKVSEVVKGLLIYDPAVRRELPDFDVVAETTLSA